jgi:hypothetical protein
MPRLLFLSFFLLYSELGTRMFATLCLSSLLGTQMFATLCLSFLLGTRMFATLCLSSLLGTQMFATLCLSSLLGTRMFATLESDVCHPPHLGARNSELGTWKCGAPEALCSAPFLNEVSFVILANLNILIDLFF